MEQTQRVRLVPTLLVAEALTVWMCHSIRGNANKWKRVTNSAFEKREKFEGRGYCRKVKSEPASY